LGFLLATAMLLVTTSVFTLINYFILPSLLFSFRRVKLIFDSMTRYEEFWIHYIYPEGSSDKRSCVIISFYYDKKEGDYLFSGENYDSNGILISSFQIRDIQFDKNINGFRYWGTAKQYKNASFSCMANFA
jgi:hypothetical protein